MTITYVIGHKNPDTDAIAAAMSYADLKQQLGQPVLAARLGPINDETKFAFKKLGIEEYPPYISDARCKLEDIQLDEIVEISKDESVNDAYDKLAKAKIRTLYVTEEKKLIGMVSMSDLTSIRLMEKELRRSLRAKSTLELIAKDVKGEIVIKSDYKTCGKVAIFSSKHSEGYYKDTISIVDNELLLIKCIKEHPSLVIFAGDEIDDLIVNAFKDNGISLIKTDMSLEDIVRTTQYTIPVGSIMTTKLIMCKSDEYVEDVANKIFSTRHRGYPVVDDDGRVKGSISRYHLFHYQKKQFILVDHSSKTQTIDHIDSAEIVEVVDHHHIGDIQTSVPINYRNQTRGATSSIVYSMYKENGLVPGRQIAGMMLSAIISDTLNFKSRTTTPIDRKNAEELAAIAGLDLETYANELLAASVNLKDADAEVVVNKDLKEYKFGEYRVSISQTNYSDIADIQARQDDFEDVLHNLQKERKYDLSVLLFTNVSAEGSMMLFYGPKAGVMSDIIETVFDDHSGFDKKIISRKQQLVPLLSKKLEQF